MISLVLYVDSSLSVNCEQKELWDKDEYLGKLKTSSFKILETHEVIKH